MIDMTMAKSAVMLMPKVAERIRKELTSTQITKGCQVVNDTWSY